MSTARATSGPIVAPAIATLAPAGAPGHGSARRVVELTIAVTALAVLAPVMLLIAVLILTTSHGPVLYRQQRVGVGGRPFEIIKFRTMRPDADDLAEAVFAHRNDASGPLHKLREDPRVTPVGRWLRRFSLDELPQLWNVVNGSMALVGPRPATQQEVAGFAEGEHRRHVVRPGLTGIAQVSGRSDLAWEDAVALDLQYVDDRSLGLDLRILLRTIPAVLGGRGAY